MSGFLSHFFFLSPRTVLHSHRRYYLTFSSDISFFGLQLLFSFSTVLIVLNTVVHQLFHIYHVHAPHDIHCRTDNFRLQLHPLTCLFGRLAFLLFICSFAYGAYWIKENRRLFFTIKPLYPVTEATTVIAFRLGCLTSTLIAKLYSERNMLTIKISTWPNLLCCTTHTVGHLQ